MTLGRAATPPPAGPDRRQKRLELLAFLLLTGVIMPALAVAIVGGYGFIVWIYQLIAGPPGPPLS